MTSPQDPWQQGQSGQQGQHPQGGYPQQPQGGQQYPGQPQQPGQQPYATPYPQPGYGVPHAAPPPPGQSGGAQRPWQVETAFWLSVVVPLLVTVLTVVSFVLAQGMIDEMIRSQLQQEGAPMTPDMLSLSKGVAMFVLGLQAFAFLVLSGLWILFGFKMRAGRNWARITLTVFAAIWLLYSLPSFISSLTGPAAVGVPAGVEAPTSMFVLGIIQTGIGVLAMVAFLVLVYLRPSNSFFQAARYRG